MQDLPASARGAGEEGGVMDIEECPYCKTKPKVYKIKQDFNYSITAQCYPGFVKTHSAECDCGMVAMGDGRYQALKAWNAKWERSSCV
jgi:hypothetical protein